MEYRLFYTHAFGVKFLKSSYLLLFPIVISALRVRYLEILRYVVVSCSYTYADLVVRGMSTRRMASK